MAQQPSNFYVCFIFEKWFDIGSYARSDLGSYFLQARKALRALKGLVKFQALVRGFLVRKRAAATLHSMQALSTVRSQRARRSMTNDTRHQPEMRARRSHSVCLQTVSAVVTGKSPLVNSDAQPSSSRGDAHHQKPDKLQSDLAAAVRGNDILKCEVQNALDTLSCAIYKLEDLELQVLKMDEHINQLTNDLQECMKELRASCGRKKTLRALKGLVKLQALVRGFLVQKRAAANLHNMQALIKAQAAV
ncbi:hypothetical protein P3S67_027869 [Capsicum chacoense]